MSRLENHAVLRDAASDVSTVCSAREMWLGRSRGSFFQWKTDFLGNCSHEGQIHSSGSSLIYFCTTPKGRKSRITLILLGNFERLLWT